MSEWSNRLLNESIKKRNNWKSVDHAKITNKKNLKSTNNSTINPNSSNLNETIYELGNEDSQLDNSKISERDSIDRKINEIDKEFNRISIRDEMNSAFYEKEETSSKKSKNSSIHKPNLVKMSEQIYPSVNIKNNQNQKSSDVNIDKLIHHLEQCKVSDIKNNLAIRDNNEKIANFRRLVAKQEEMIIEQQKEIKHQASLVKLKDFEKHNLEDEMHIKDGQMFENEAKIFQKYQDLEEEIDQVRNSKENTLKVVIEQEKIVKEVKVNAENFKNLSQNINEIMVTKYDNQITRQDTLETFTKKKLDKISSDFESLKNVSNSEHVLRQLDTLNKVNESQNTNMSLNSRIYADYRERSSDLKEVERKIDIAKSGSAMYYEAQNKAETMVCITQFMFGVIVMLFLSMILIFMKQLTGF